MRAPVAGGGPAVTLVASEAVPQGLAIDPAPPSSGPIAPLVGDVARAPIAGGAPTTLASSQSSPSAVAVDGAHAIWTNEGTDADGGALQLRGRLLTSDVGGLLTARLVSGTPPAS